MSMRKDPSNPTNFGGPQVAPGVAVDPRVQKYQQEINQRRSPQPLPGYSTPVGGSPPQKIPLLNQQPSGTGLTMADYAAQQQPLQQELTPEMIAAQTPLSDQQKAALGLPSTPGGTPFFQSSGAPSAGPLPPLARPSSPLLPGDILPERAKEDPAFQQGVGS